MAGNAQRSNFRCFCLHHWFCFFLLGIHLFLKIFFQRRSIKGLTKKIPKDRSAQPGDLEKLKAEFPENEHLSFPKRFSGRSSLSEAWQEFQNSLITRQRVGNQNVIYKTDEASVFFSEERLLDQNLNLRFWNSVPALLVGVGILGTFVGLVWGLIPFSGIDFSQTTNIQEAIRGLLSGVSTAFVTSVWGMLASLMFNFLEKFGIGSIRKAVAELQRTLDQLFTLTTQEEIAFRQEDELAQQTQALKAFSTDLANQIKIAMDSIMSDTRNQSDQSNQEIIQALRDVPDAVSNALAGQLAPRLDNLSTIVSDIQSVTEQGKQEIFQELHKLRLSSGQKEILAKMVGGMNENLGGLLGHVAQITYNTQELLKLAANQTVGRPNQWLADMDKFLQRSAQTLKDVQQSTGKLLQLQKEQIEATTNQLANSRATLASGNDILKQMNESVTSVRQINEENQKYLTANRKSMQQIQSALAESRHLLSDSAQCFQVINDGLQSIFAEIEKGLNTYATSTRKSINTYLTDFSNQLMKALEALSETVEVLEDTVADLKDKSTGKK